MVWVVVWFEACCSGKKSAQHLVSKVLGMDLATTYSHRTCRPTTIGAAAFHFRVRNGTGWFHRALVTRGQLWGRLAGAKRIPTLGLWGPEKFLSLLGFSFQFSGKEASRWACSLLKTEH